MAQQPQIIAPREPIADEKGQPTRTWWRFLNNLSTLSGRLLNPLTVSPNAILNASTLTSGGEISSPDLPGNSLIGNSNSQAAQPEVVPIDTSLAMSGGSLGVAPLPGLTLAGNSGIAAAQQVGITPVFPLVLRDNELQLSDTGAPSAADNETLANSIPDRSGQVATLERQVGDLQRQIAQNRDRSSQVSALERAVDDLAKLALLSASRPGGSSAAATPSRYTFFGSGSGTSAIPLTTDGTAAGPTNIANLPNLSAQSFAATVCVYDTTTGGSTSFVGRDTSGAPAVIKRGANAAATTMSTVVWTQGPTLGTITHIGAMSAAPDTTNGGYAFAYTPGLLNAEQIDVTLALDVAQAQ